MRHWFSPLPLSPALVAVLSKAGLTARPPEESDAPTAGCLLVYDRPDRLIQAAAALDQALTLPQIREAYQQLLAWADATSQPLLAGWRLEGVEAASLHTWLQDGSPLATPAAAATTIPPLLAASLHGLLDTQPELLDAYSDLELRAELLGDEPDVHYRQRLLRDLQVADPLAELLASLQTPAAVRELEACVAERDAELRDAREEAELTLLQLHQVQEELEQIFLADRQKQQDLEQLQAQHQELEQQLQARDAELQEARHSAEEISRQLQPRLHELEQQLQARDAELQVARHSAEEISQQLQPRLHELEQQLQARDAELKEAREEAELTLLQLHQVQEELEHYFLLARGQGALLGQYGEQHQRVQRLLSRLLTGSAAPAAVPQR